MSDLVMTYKFLNDEFWWKRQREIADSLSNLKDRPPISREDIQNIKVPYVVVYSEEYQPSYIIVTINQLPAWIKVSDENTTNHSG